ncbi:transposase [Kitasatospora sp. NPDC058965]|uniref:transposase n=1 Tax=Kitasatospora sp. NPDC058965 TaxID=3346682 RepID=UPI00369916ED
MLIVDGTLVSTRGHSIAEQSKNYRYPTNHQVVVDAHTRLVVMGRLAASRQPERPAKPGGESGAKAAVGRATTIADGGYPGTGLVIPHRRPRGGELTEWQVEQNRENKRVRARVEHIFARMKTWKILCDCRLKGDRVHRAMQIRRPAGCARPVSLTRFAPLSPPSGARLPYGGPWHHRDGGSRR